MSRCRSNPLIGCLAFWKLGDEVLGQFRADFGVALLGLRDELFQPVMIVTGGELEVVLAALHVPVMRVEQAPRLVIIGVRFDESGNCGRSVLDRLAHPVGFDQDLGSGGDQRPPSLDRWNHVGPESGQAILGQLQQGRGRRLEQFAFHMHQQSPLDAQEGFVFLERFHGQFKLVEAKFLFDLVGHGHVAVPHVPAVSPCSSQSHAGIDAARAGGHGDRRKRRWHLLLEGGEQIGQQDMSPQPAPANSTGLRRREVRCRS